MKGGGRFVCGSVWGGSLSGGSGRRGSRRGVS